MELTFSTSKEVNNDCLVYIQTSLEHNKNHAFRFAAHRDFLCALLKLMSEVKAVSDKIARDAPMITTSLSSASKCNYLIVINDKKVQTASC